MEVRYGLQPISDIFGHRREIVAPPHDTGLVPSQAPGQVTHGPPHYGQANQEPVAGHLSRHRRMLKSWITNHKAGCLAVFRMNTVATSIPAGRVIGS